MGELIEQTGYEHRADRVIRRDIKRRLGAIETHTKHAVEAAWEAGGLLTELKRRTPHGEWLPYLDSVGLAERMAQNYMRIFREYRRDELAALPSVRQAIALAQLTRDKPETRCGNKDPDPPPTYEGDRERRRFYRLAKDAFDPNRLLEVDKLKERARELSDADVNMLLGSLSMVREVVQLEAAARKDVEAKRQQGDIGI